MIPSLTSSSAAVIPIKHGKFIAFIESCRIHPEKTLADSAERVELATRDAELSKDQAVIESRIQGRRDHADIKRP